MENKKTEKEPYLGPKLGTELRPPPLDPADVRRLEQAGNDEEGKILLEQGDEVQVEELAQHGLQGGVAGLQAHRHAVRHQAVSKRSKKYSRKKSGFPFPVR
jgi:hypothetical protein